MASSRTSYEDGHARTPRQKHTFHDDADDGHIQSSKRQRNFLDEPRNAQSACVNSPSVPRHEQYTVAWICALHIEMAAAEAMLDEAHDTLPIDAEDINTYTLGRVGSHNIVIAGLPTGQYGTNNAANVVSNLKRSFPSIRAGLMVGIGGGAPSKCDIRLGDVVVGTRVMQCDLGKSVGDGQLRRTATPRIPSQSLGTAVTALRAKHERKSSSISMIVEERFEHNASYRRPTSPDELFPATYEHLSTKSDCSGCDLSKLVPRSVRDHPSIHYGAIASGNQVMRSASQRDSIAQELDIICFEMEAAGIMDVIPCLPIRGICDYADSHKNKTWQRYAAATAAAYARQLLAVLSTSETRSYTHFDDSCKSQAAIERNQLLEVLKFDQLESRELTIKVAHVKTCQWLLEDPYYRAWLDPEKLINHHGFLWIRGKPGAGKSIIMKFAYSNMLKRRRKETVTAAFFFNARGESLEKSIEGMYRSLLIQVLQGFPKLQPVSSDHNPITESEDACPPLEALKELFQSAVLSLGQRRLTCFIDALDECDEQQVMDMIETFEDLAEKTAADGIPFRVCFSSRHYPYITIRKGVEFTLENRPGHTDDLANYATSRLRVTDDNLSSELKQELLEKASGVFLWLALVVDILNKEYARGGMGLRKTLEKIPSDLHDLFKDMLQRDDANKEQLLLSVLWILCARRPLHPSEFSHAVWAGLSLQGLADPDPPDITTSDTDLRTDRYVVGSSKGLAEITRGDRPTVQFIHESVRDFLLSAGGLQELWPDLGFDWEIPSHDKLKRCSEAYISHPSITRPVDRVLAGTTSKGEPDNLERFTFLEYSVKNVFYHADVAAQGICQDNFLSAFRIPDWIHISNYFERHRARQYTRKADILYVLAERGFSNLIRTRLRKYPKTDVRGERYQYPLFTALAHDQGDAAAALLGLQSRIYNGKDIARGLKTRKDLEDSEGRTPLTWAAQEGRADICDLLLQNGYHVDELDSNHWTPLTIAMHYNHFEVTELLIDRGAAHKTIALGVASRKGKEEFVRLLLEKGVSIYDNGSGGESSALLFASRGGHREIVKLLLDKGADSHRSNDLKRALSTVSSCGQLEVMKLLLDEGANVQNDDAPGQQPLALAMRACHYEAARLLIDKGANFTCSGVRWEPSQAPPEIVMLLVERGADLTHCSQKLLDFAIQKRNETLLRHSVNIGADLDCVGKDPTVVRPLLRAVTWSDETVVRLLLELGADVNISNGGGTTPLYMAVSRGHEAIVKLLIEKGANVNPETDSDDSPLEVALERGHDTIARLLVEKGAKVPLRYQIDAHGVKNGVYLEDSCSTPPD